MLSLRDGLPFLIALTAAIVLLSPMVALASPEATGRASQFLKEHEARVRPLEVAASLAWWNANTSGKDEDFKKKEDAQNRLDAVLADPRHFRQVKELQEQGRIDDPAVARAVAVIYLACLEKQVDPDLLKKLV